MGIFNAKPSIGCYIFYKNTSTGFWGGERIVPTISQVALNIEFEQLSWEDQTNTIWSYHSSWRKHFGDLPWSGEGQTEEALVSTEQDCGELVHEMDFHDLS